MKKLQIVLLLLSFSILYAQEQNNTIDYSIINIKYKQNLKKEDKDIIHAQQGLEAKHFKHLKQWSTVKLKSNNRRNNDNILANFRKNKLVESANYSRIFKTFDNIPNDPQYILQWGPQKIQAAKAWDIKTSNEVVIAVIDTGIDYNHEDLRDNLWTGSAGEHGYQCFGGVTTIGGQDDHFHGTHVAGTIAAVGNNNLGITGLNWKAKLIAFKFLNAGGSGNDVDGALIIEKMVDVKKSGVNIRVSNNSWGGDGISELIRDAFLLAEENGIINICAAGNSNVDVDLVPSTPGGLDLEGIVSVLASDSNDNKASFSNYGFISTDLLAPGVSILSCKLNGGYWNLNGTSMASPHVAGVVAMMFAIQTNLNVKTCKSILLDRASLDQTSFTECSTLGGRLNMYKAVTNPRLTDLNSLTNVKPTIVTSTNLIIVSPGQSVTIGAIGSDANGDSLVYSYRGGGKHLDDGLLEKTFSGYLKVTGNTNVVTLTNVPMAVDMSLELRFFVFDGHGESASTTVDVFMQKDANLIKDLSQYVPGVQINHLDTNRMEIWFESELNNLNFAFDHWGGGFSEWHCCQPVYQRKIIYKYSGLNIIHGFVADTKGNFYDIPAISLYIGNPTFPAPFAKVSVNTSFDITPFNVQADMSATDLSRTNTYLYFWDYWRKFGSDTDFYNPIKNFTLTKLGLHPIHFEVFDYGNNRNIWDKTVVLFTVLPKGLPHPPIPDQLLAPSNLQVIRTNDFLNISWQDNAIGEDTYEIEWNQFINGRWSGFYSMAQLEGNTDNFSIISKKGRYEFRVHACKIAVGECSPYSNVASIRLK